MANRKYLKECTDSNNFHWIKPRLWHPNNFFIPGKSYHYESNTGEKMMEQHADDLSGTNINGEKTEISYLPKFMMSAPLFTALASTRTLKKNQCSS
jgi:hypothetical protein